MCKHRKKKMKKIDSSTHLNDIVFLYEYNIRTTLHVSFGHSPSGVIAPRIRTDGVTYGYWEIFTRKIFRRDHRIDGRLAPRVVFFLFSIVVVVNNRFFFTDYYRGRRYKVGRRSRSYETEFFSFFFYVTSWRCFSNFVLNRPAACKT